jgi:hypothetical protein
MTTNTLDAQPHRSVGDGTVLRYLVPGNPLHTGLFFALGGGRWLRRHSRSTVREER